MKIVVYDNSGHPFQVQLSRQLAKLGNDVSHIYSKSFNTPHGNLAVQKDDPSSFKIIGIELKKNIAKYNFIKRKFQEKSFAQEVKKVLKQLQPEIIICSNVPLDTLVIVQKYCKKNNIKFIIWIQDIYSIAIKNYFDKKNKALSFLLYKYYFFIESNIFRKSDACISISKDFNPILIEMGVNSENIKVIENWANLDEILIKEKANEWAQKNDLDKTFNFCYTGTMGLKHNPDLIIELSQHFDDKNVKIVVTSQGIGANYLITKKEEMNLNNLVLLPFQDYSQYSNVLATADVLVAVLEKDAGILSIPSKILSYHCASKPILAAMPLDNLASKILLNNNSGLVSDTDDIKSFLTNADELFYNSQLRSELSKNAINYAKGKFNINLITDIFLKIIKQLNLENT